MIEVKNLTKYYGPTLAIDNISFSIEQGQIVGFLGPNGAGKTTTIRVLTCFMPATSGSATIAGHDVFSESLEVRQRIGYLPESVPFYPEMRVREYLQFRGQLRDMEKGKLKQRIGYVSERCWLSDVFNRPIGQLSKGFRQRLGLADALLHDPDVLILDEPTVGLDPTQIRATRQLIKDLGERHTILLSSHILPEVEAVCKQTIIISGGRIVAKGSIEDLRRQIREHSRLIVELKGPKDSIESSIRGIESVKSIDVTPTDGYLRLAIEVAERSDPRERIYELASRNKWSLREMRLEVATLEDFFVRAVAQQGARAAAVAEA
ncbi:MAG: ATP-binding cassette domain-containing protein [Phycisphaerae bacterium]|nr:ATP-binding cassette domain-containing protein [Phycisphaerae bacterium]